MYQHIIIIIATIIIIIIIIKRHSFECQKVIGDLLCYKIGLLVVLQFTVTIVDNGTCTCIPLNLWRHAYF